MTWQSPYVYDNRFGEITRGYYMCSDHSYRGSIPGPDCNPDCCQGYEVVVSSKLTSTHTTTKHTSLSWAILSRHVLFHKDVYGEIQR